MERTRLPTGPPPAPDEPVCVAFNVIEGLKLGPWETLKLQAVLLNQTTACHPRF